MKLFTVLSIATTAAAVAHPPLSARQSSASSAQTPSFSYEDLLALQHKFWNVFKYPNNVKEAESINSTIFSEDVQGRVSDTRNFVGRELNTEYIFGLFVPSPGSISVIGRPGDYEILQFVANQNIASATTRVMFTFPSFGDKVLPVVIDTWFTWNEAREISQYDVVFRWFGYLLDTLITGAGSGTPEENSQKAVQGIATSVCSQHTQFCNGTNQQYESADACFKFLTQDIRVGSSYELGMNTLLCRNIHEHMVRFRPDVHCSHIGPSGGGMCDDTISYIDKVSETYFTNSPWIPTVFEPSSANLQGRW